MITSTGQASPGSLFWNKKWIFKLICVVVFVLGLVLVIQYSQLGSRAYVPTIKGTNVASISIVMTHGTNHTFYYPGRLSWELEQACKRFGLVKRVESQRLVSHTSEVSDMIWLTCKHCGQTPSPQNFRLVIIDPKGHEHRISPSSGVCDSTRRLSVCRFPLAGGVTNHHGSTLHITDATGRTELVSIEVL